MFKTKMKAYQLVFLLLVILLTFIGCTDSEPMVEETSQTNEQTTVSDVNESNEIKVRVIEFPPFYYSQEDQWTGLEVELANAMVLEAGFTPVHESLPWSRALKAMELGEIDLMMNLVKTPDREAYMRFIGPIRSTRMALVVSEDHSHEKIETIEDLFNVSKRLELPLGLQKDVKYPKELASKLEDEAYKNYMDFTYATKMYPSNVRDNRLLGFVEDEVAMKYQIENNVDFQGLVLHPFLFSEDDVYAGISKKLNQDKYDRLKAAFEKLKENGSFEEIIRTYQ